MATKVVRNIYFYRINIGRDQSGDPLSFDPVPALRAIDEIPLDENGKCPRRLGSGNCLWIFFDRPRPSVLFGRSRYDDLPRVETRGQFSELPIGADSGINEAIHAVFFVEDGRPTIVGSDFNFHGPRFLRLREYMQQLTPKFCPKQFDFEVLIRADVMARIADLQTIRLFSIKARRSAIEYIEAADDNLGSAFRNAERLVAPDSDGRSVAADDITLSVNISATRKRSSTIGESVRKMAANLLRSPELRDGDSPGKLSNLDIGGISNKTGKMDVVDLLSDKLISRRSISRLSGNTRALNPRAAFRAIERAYEDLYDELIKASSVITD